VWELLLSADYMVPDPDAMAETLSKALGLPPAKPGHRQDFDNHHYIAHFLRVHPSLAVAPTRLEPQGHVDKAAPPSDPIFGEFLDSLAEFQGRHRPIKAHSNVLVTSDMPGLVERLMRRRVPFRVAPWSPEMPFDRLWIGATPDRPRYRPDWDGGLMIEVIPVGPLRMPDAAYADPPAEPRDPAEGEMVRIVHRSYLVRHLESTLALVSANLGLDASEPISQHDDEGYRRARLRFGIRNSATLDLLQPTRGDTAAGRYVNIWGPGPYVARIAVNGLDAKADDLRSRGTGFDVVEATSACPRRLVVHAADVGGAEIELVEASEA
jgi:hypothetical protein